MDKTINSYKKSGVNIDLGNQFVKHISKLTKSKGNNPMLFSKIQVHLVQFMISEN